MHTIIEKMIQDLAELPPGPAALAKAEELRELVHNQLINNQSANQLIDHPAIDELHDKHEENAIKIEQNKALISDWSSFFSTPVGKVVGGMVLSLLTIFSVWLSGKMDPKPIPVVVPVTTEVTKVTSESKINESKPPEKAKNKVVLYTTTDTQLVKDDLALKKLDIVVQTGYLTGQPYTFNGKAIPVPCMALVAADGKVLDVQPWDGTVASIINFVK